MWIWIKRKISQQKETVRPPLREQRPEQSTAPFRHQRRPREQQATRATAQEEPQQPPAPEQEEGPRRGQQLQAPGDRGTRGGLSAEQLSVVGVVPQEVRGVAAGKD
ncbi:unnamed protein product [Callosobruchus maculatus]|uniref:Uncharacterized protein n=1 Tax=Callosobruchus maculatus TaxID=64391 RepID=A0A653DWG4_CALMS|nr:unnamed protein product [Callosobruchus maculatus]